MLQSTHTKPAQPAEPAQPAQPAQHRPIAAREMQVLGLKTRKNPLSLLSVAEVVTATAQCTLHTAYISARRGLQVARAYGSHPI